MPDYKHPFRRSNLQTLSRIFGERSLPDIIADLKLSKNRVHAIFNNKVIAVIKDIPKSLDKMRSQGQDESREFAVLDEAYKMANE